MTYYISFVTDCDAHQALFPTDSEGNPIMPYDMVGNCAKVRVVTGTYVDDFEVTKNLFKCCPVNRQSAALICVADDFVALDGQTLYPATPEGKATCMAAHPELDYTMLSQSWVGGTLTP